MPRPTYIDPKTAKELRPPIPPGWYIVTYDPLSGKNIYTDAVEPDEEPKKTPEPGM